MDNNAEKLDQTINSTVEHAVESVKEKVTAPIKTPPSLQAKSSAGDLKNRLEWGEPALTIVDVRHRAAFNQEHIMGAISIAPDELVERIGSSMEPNRDIYIYGDSIDATAQAATALRQAGFFNVAEIEGGLEAWKAISGAVEGTAEVQEPDAGAYNVVSRINQHREAQRG
ncbi:MAG: rhodanese-like domain-containing protein [Leptolyngbyaceae cyanobacterium SL_7_1]|nr:rhodanese-like domain-containing protein [Leptolyngbyaceae cyanobacterium SL_7_1]